jgi:CRP-like cAMP-binding protein
MLTELRQFVAQFPSLTEEEINDIVEHLSVQQFKKGTILLHEGAVSTLCYFVLKGCVRQFCTVNEEERTVEFYTENQTVVLFSSYGQQTPSKYSFVCAEDCTLIVGDMAQEQAMYDQFPKLASITRGMVEQHFGKTQEDFATFITSSAEERYTRLLATRPDVFQRVPQHHIASYLGVTPESLSRIRKRMLMNKNR